MFPFVKFLPFSTGDKINQPCFFLLGQSLVLSSCTTASIQEVKVDFSVNLHVSMNTFHSIMFKKNLYLQLLKAPVRDFLNQRILLKKQKTQHEYMQYHKPNHFANWSYIIKPLIHSRKSSLHHTRMYCVG